MELDRVSLEGEQTLAIFSCRSHLADTTLLRAQTVDVVIHHLEGIRVPRKALRRSPLAVRERMAVMEESTCPSSREASVAWVPEDRAYWSCSISAERVGTKP